MARATPSDVLVTFDADASDAEVQQWIDQASVIADDVDAAGSVTDARLEQIELLLAQHFLAAQYPRFTSQSGGSRKADFGEGRDGNAYLARAKRLDPTGVVEESLEAEKFTLSTG